MKKILITLLFFLPIVAWADDNKDEKYLAGAVPEVNGQVLFQQTFAVKGKSQSEIYQTMKEFVEKMTQEENQLSRTRITSDDANKGIITARFEEWLVFKKKILYLDRTRFNYILNVECSDNKCHMVLTQISYYYEEELDGSNGRTFLAEEWISDEKAINKKGTKLYPVSGKFRRKTVDRVEEIFKNARDYFEVKARETYKATELITE